MEKPPVPDVPEFALKKSKPNAGNFTPDHTIGSWFSSVFGSSIDTFGD
jgi:hypothetical protein